MIISREDIQKKLESIRRIVLENAERFRIEIVKVILFGSRARGDHRENSDWDILIVVGERTDPQVLDELWLSVKRALVAIGIIPEIIIVSAEDYSKRRHFTGYIYYWAEREGIVIT